jgi:hypothetical protein
MVMVMMMAEVQWWLQPIQMVELAGKDRSVVVMQLCKEWSFPKSLRVH